MPDPRRAAAATLVACLAWGGAGAAGAAEVVFAIDPVRSTVQIAAGSQTVLDLPQSFSGYGLGTRTMPHLAPTGGTAGRLPDGTTSDGLRTAVEGLLRTDLDDPPTQLRIARDATFLRLGPSGLWLPGLPNEPATPAEAALALRFTDAALNWSWRAALRDWQLSLSTEGVHAALAAGGADTWSFSAGCTPPAAGCPVFRVENGNVDSADGRGFLARSGFRHTRDPLANPPATQGSLVRRPDQKLELTVPIALTLVVDGLDLHDPLGLDHTLVLSGQIVAVPEPGAGGAAAGAALAGLALARRGARRRRRAAAALALAALPALGCYDVLDTTLNKTGFVDPFACVTERLRVYERINNDDVLIGGGDIQNSLCNANGISASGTISGGTAFSTLSKSQWEYGAYGSRLLVGSTFDLGGVPQYALKYRYEATFQVSYEPATTTALNAPRYFNYAWDYGLGAAPSATQSGTITIDGLTFPADWNTRRVVLNPMGGTLNVKLELEGFRNQAGKHYQGVVLFGGIQPSKPHTNLDCRRAFGEEFQFRVRTDLIAPYCSPGSVGSACEESSQCRENLVCRDGTCVKNLYPYGRIQLTF